MSMTPEHKAAMQEGRRRRAEEDRQTKARQKTAYSDWVREDARLWREMMGADLNSPRYRAARAAWLANQRLMPELP